METTKTQPPFMGSGTTLANTGDIHAGEHRIDPNPITAFRAFADAPRTINSPSKKGLTTPKDTSNQPPIAAPAPLTSSVSVVPVTPIPSVAAALPVNDATTMSALALRAEAAEVAQVCASNATRAVTATSCFLRFAISVFLVRGDQQTSDRSIRHYPIFGGSSHTGNDFATKRWVDIALIGPSYRL